MLSFFRRFQKGIFIAITIVIVVSFSFFGTYSLFDKQVRDEVVFTAVDGNAVKRSEVEALTAFLTSDSLDQMNWGTPLGANFLNDGVVRNDFLKAGLGKVLFEAYYPELKEEWEGKWKRERVYQSYKHPEVAFFSADAVWTHFAPNLKESLRNYKATSSENPIDQFEKKASLYLAEGGFSEQMLRQVLHYQLQQAKWIKPDRNLQQQNLALFGYKNLNDWFGHDYLRLVSSFILNCAKVADREGYKVSHDEALYDLKKRALLAFETQKQNPLMTFTDPNQYLREQLRYLGMDLGQATEIWQKVLLFRKMFNDLGSSVLVDKESFAPFVDYVAKQVEVETYRLPRDVQIRDFRQFQRLETYLGAVGKEFNNGFPTKWNRVDEVSEELLIKRYLVDLKEVDHKDVAQKINLKQLWQWQVSDKGWEKLENEFAVLKTGASIEDERFAALDSLDERTKELVDQKTRMFIAEEHPEWIEEALAQAPSEPRTLIFYKKASKNPLKGLTKPEKAVAMLDLPDLDEANPPVVTLRDVGDQTWSVKIYDRSTTWEVATFGEAEKDGVIEQMALVSLQNKYDELKETSSNYQLADGSYKPLNDVRDQIAQEVFRKEINRIKRSMPEQDSQSIDLASSYALQSYLNAKREEVALGNEESILKIVPVVQDKLMPRVDLEDQFKLVKQEAVWDRTQNGLGTSFQSILSIETNKTSNVIRQSNGDLFFFRVLGSQSQAKEELFTKMVGETRQALSFQLQETLAVRLLKEFKDKEAISLVVFRGEKARREV